MQQTIEAINNELEIWKNYYNNEEKTIDSILIDVLASMPADERDERISRAKEILTSLQEPITVSKTFESIKEDLDMQEKVKSESEIAYRTLAWVKSVIETNTLAEGFDGNVSLMMAESGNTEGELELI